MLAHQSFKCSRIGIPYLCHIIDDETVHSIVVTRLMPCQFISDSDYPCEALYLTRDDEGCDRLCYTSLDALFVQINQVLTGSKKENQFPTSFT